LPPSTFLGLIAIKIAFAAGAPPRGPRRGAISAHPDSQTGFQGKGKGKRNWRGRKVNDFRGGQEEWRNARGKGGVPPKKWARSASVKNYSSKLLVTGF